MADFSKRWTLSVCVLMLMIGASVIDAAETFNDGICQSKDTRNHPYELNSLRGCRVIEGFLMISLMSRREEPGFDNITFPDLVEITDFLLLFGVERLTTLAHLFPNLRVIRGNNLYGNYALVIYDMLQLQDIGLKSLTTISRGFVRIEKNPSLCFVDTIDWTYIANGTQLGDHFFDSNKNHNECDVYPDGRNSEIECPTSKRDPNARLCWNRQTCQKICPDICGGGSCDDNLICCDKSCLGSCHADGTNCTLCQKLSVGRLTAPRCVDTCPSGLFRYENRRCITDEECWNVTRPVASDPKNIHKYPFIPFNGECILTCPEQHAVIDLDDGTGRRSCRSCNGVCKKECRGSVVENIAAAQAYRGCVIITGTLILQIRREGRNVVRELEEALSSIEEIEGALKVTRAFPLVSLNFFKNLRVIHVNRLTDSYALAVMDNPNLQSLFDHQVTIAKGRLFFHFNAKLCYDVILGLKTDTNDLSNVDRIAVEDVAPNSNGDKVACNMARLTASASIVMPFGAIIDVTQMRYDDSRVLLGYVLYYKPTQFRNVSLFDNRDACGGDGWLVAEVADFDRNDRSVLIVVTNLKPFTEYAYYVETYTVSSETTVGQSDINYFQTSNQ